MPSTSAKEQPRPAKCPDYPGSWLPPARSPLDADAAREDYRLNLESRIVQLEKDLESFKSHRENKIMSVAKVRKKRARKSVGQIPSGQVLGLSLPNSNQMSSPSNDRTATSTSHHGAGYAADSGIGESGLKLTRAGRDLRRDMATGQGEPSANDTKQYREQVDGDAKGGETKRRGTI